MSVPTYEDETRIRALYQRVLDGWVDPYAYGACFTSDADHISTTGRLDHGRDEIVDTHSVLLSTWAAGSALTGRIDRLQFLTGEVALLTVYSEIGGGNERRRTIDTLTAQQVDGRWVFVTCQRTPLGRWPQPATRRPGDAEDRNARAQPQRAATTPTDDEAEIRARYRRMLDCWLDAPAYAECFSAEADYITGGGKLERGWQENVEGHQAIFSAWARQSRLEGRIEKVRFLTPDVAVVTAYGHIVYLDGRSSDDDKRTIYTVTAQKIGGGWIFVGYQNTPLKSW